MPLINPLIYGENIAKTAEHDCDADFTQNSERYDADFTCTIYAHIF